MKIPIFEENEMNKIVLIRIELTCLIEGSIYDNYGLV